LGEENLPAPPFRVSASADIFHPGCGLGFYQNFPLYAPGALPSAEAEALLRKIVDWQGQRNVFAQPGNFISLGAMREALEPTRVRSTLDDFRQFWGPTDADSLQGPLFYQGANVATKAATAPDELTPSDFRLRFGSAGFNAGADGRDHGSDVDIVGPGAAYERWKAYSAHREWLQATGRSR
jgi:hypothetical protein